MTLRRVYARPPALASVCALAYAPGTMIERTKPDLRAPTTTCSARLTESGERALRKHAGKLCAQRSDGQRALLVWALRQHGHNIDDDRADRTLGEGFYAPGSEHRGDHKATRAAYRAKQKAADA